MGWREKWLLQRNTVFKWKNTHRRKQTRGKIVRNLLGKEARSPATMAITILSSWPSRTVLRASSMPYSPSSRLPAWRPCKLHGFFSFSIKLNKNIFVQTEKTVSSRLSDSKLRLPEENGRPRDYYAITALLRLALLINSLFHFDSFVSNNYSNKIKFSI